MLFNQLSFTSKAYSMNIPSNLMYTQEHEWIKVTNNEAHIGITQYAQKALGNIIFIGIETEGESLEQDSIFGSVEADETITDLFMPVDGRVLEINEIIQDNPNTINSDPYGEGWIIKIEIEAESQLGELLTAEEYAEFINE